MKQPARKRISGPIVKVKIITKHGKPEVHREKFLPQAVENEPEDVKKTLTDTVNRIKRKVMNSKVRRTAHTNIADFYKEVSDEQNALRKQA